MAKIYDIIFNFVEDNPSIKSCPFCGGNFLEMSREEDFARIYAEKGSAAICISCTRCSVEMFEYTFGKEGVDYSEMKSRLVERWNTRV